MFDEIYAVPLNNHIRVASKAKPYNKMSKLGKALYEAREMGMTYGHYIGHRDNGQIPHKQEVIRGGKVYIE